MYGILYFFVQGFAYFFSSRKLFFKIRGVRVHPFEILNLRTILSKTKPSTSTLYSIPFTDFRPRDQPVSIVPRIIEEPVYRNKTVTKIRALRDPAFYTVYTCSNKSCDRPVEYIEPPFVPCRRDFDGETFHSNALHYLCKKKWTLACTGSFTASLQTPSPTLYEPL